MSIQPYLETFLSHRGIDLDTSSDQELMYALTAAVRELQRPMPHAQGERKLYYFSAEFLVGRLLRANLINLGLLEEVEALLAAHGRSLAQIEDQEPEPSLGNGGLGRLAACFLDSIASLGLNGDGVGLNYHYGLFRQRLDTGLQMEEPDPWIAPESWLLDAGFSYQVDFGGFSLIAKQYDLEIPGYENGVCNFLMWSGRQRRPRKASDLIKQILPVI